MSQKLTENTIGKHLAEVSERLEQFDQHPAVTLGDINFPPTQSELDEIKKLYSELENDWELLTQYSKKHASDGLSAIISELDKRIVQFDKLGY